MNKLISIVIPAYNEEGNILKIVEHIFLVMKTLPYSYEIIFVNDGSVDKTVDKIIEAQKKHPHTYYINFSKNFGHQLAVKAGIDNAFGDCVVTMDCDMQHPPQLIIKMIQHWEQGFELVYTLRKIDKKLPFFKRLNSILFYKMINFLSNINIEDGAADFRLMDKKVVDVFRKFNEADPFLRGLVKWVGFKQISIQYKPDKRFSGTTKYSLKKMFNLAINGLTSFSLKPLYMAIYLGFVFSFISVLYVPYVFYVYFAGYGVSGWASLLMTIVFFAGLQLIILGIIGIYVGKIFIQSKGRPNYIIASHNLIKSQND